MWLVGELEEREGGRWEENGEVLDVKQCLKYPLCITLALNWHQPLRG